MDESLVDNGHADLRVYCCARAVVFASKQLADASTLLYDFMAYVSSACAGVTFNPGSRRTHSVVGHWAYFRCLLSSPEKTIVKPALFPNLSLSKIPPPSSLALLPSVHITATSPCLRQPLKTPIGNRSASGASGVGGVRDCLSPYRESLIGSAVIRRTLFFIAPLQLCVFALNPFRPGPGRQAVSEPGASLCQLRVYP